MTARTPRATDPANEPAQSEQQAWIDMLHSRIDGLVLESAEHRRLFEPILLPLLKQPDDEQETFKVERRRSLDDMEFALKRLMQPEPRPVDDDSQQVLHDAIHEVIALRQITNDLIQASMNVYQRGLSSIRMMTEK